MGRLGHAAMWRLSAATAALTAVAGVLGLAISDGGAGSSLSDLTVAGAGSLARRHLARALGAVRLARRSNEPRMAWRARSRRASWTVGGSIPHAGMVEALTRRELEVLRLLAAGMSNAQVARSLFLSVNTVKTHLKNVYGKLEVSSRTQAIARAHTLGLVGVVDPEARRQSVSNRSPLAA